MELTKRLTRGSKVLIVLATLMTVLILFGSGEGTAEVITEGDYQYTVDYYGNVEITKYIGDGGDVDIPSTLGGKTVTSIGSYVFRGNDTVTGVTIPASVSEMSSGAFMECTNLVYATFSAGSLLENIPGSAFKGCTSLEAFTVPENVTSIGAGYSGSSFEGCTSLKTFAIPDKVTFLGGWTFRNCTSLETVNISSNSQLEKFGTGYNGVASAFVGCSSLKSIYLPKGVGYPINATEFEGCTSLTEFQVHPDSTGFMTVDGALYYKGSVQVEGESKVAPTTLYIYPMGKAEDTFVAPDGMMHVNSYAFMGSKLKSIDLSNTGIETLPEGLFKDCKDLVTFEVPASVSFIGYRIFSGCDSLETVTVETGNEQIKIHQGTLVSRNVVVSAFDQDITEFTMPGKYIQTYTFSGFSTLKSLKLSSVVDALYIGVKSDKEFSFPTNSLTFDGCAPELVGVTSAVEGYTIVGIYEDEDLYRGISDIKEYRGKAYILWETVHEGSKYQFSIVDGKAVIHGYDGSDKELVVPSKLGGFDVSAIGQGSVFGSGPFTKVTLPATIETIGAGAFQGCTDLVNVVLLGEPYDVNSSAFKGCTKLVTFEGVVKGRIFEKAFEGCSSLTTIDLSSATFIGSSAFSGCISLESVNIRATELGMYAFQGCTSLSNLIFAHYYADTERYHFIQEIGYGAFQGCKSLTSVYIPESVTDIGTFAFLGCTSLVGFDVDLDNNQYAGPNGVLLSKDVTELIQYPSAKPQEAYEVPINVKYILDSAFYDNPFLVNVKIPASVTSISTPCFIDCPSLTSIDVDQNNELYRSIDGVLFTREVTYSEDVIVDDQTTSLVRYPSGRAADIYTVPEGPTSTSSAAFEDAIFLETITLSNSILEVSHQTFHGCTSLVTVHLGNKVQRIDDSFGDNPALESITMNVPEGGRFISASPSQIDFLGNSNLIKDASGTATIRILYREISADESYRILYTVSPTYQVVFVGPETTDRVTQSFNYGVPQALQANTFDNGDKRFYGWNTDEYGDGDFFTDGQVVSEKDLPIDTVIYLFAQWMDADMYVLSFRNTGSTWIEPIIQPAGTAVTKPQDPEWYGYTFKGWDMTIPDVMPSKDMVFTAIWEPLHGKIIFDTNGGSPIDPIVQVPGTKVIPPEEPVKEGHKFVGWLPELPELMPEGDITVVAQWQLESFKITFDTAGGTNIDPIVAPYGSAIVAPANPQRDGYIFVRWDKTIPDTMPAENITITAIWEPRISRIVFDFNDGVTPEMTIDQIEDNAMVHPDVPDRTGFEFKFWTFVKDDPDQRVPDDYIVDFVGIKIFYAYWEEIKYRVEFLDHDGSLWSEAFYKAGEVIVAPSNSPVMPEDGMHYEFHAWAGFVEGMVVTGPMTFYPIFIAVPQSLEQPVDGTVDIDGLVDIVDVSNLLDNINQWVHDGSLTTVSFNLNQGSVSMDQNVLGMLDNQNATVGIESVVGMPQSIASKVGDRPVYDVFIGGLHQLNGSITITFKYELKPGETADNIRIWHFDSDGNYVEETCTYDSERKEVTFTTTYLSYFSVMHESSGSGGDDSGGLGMGIIIAVVAIVAVAGVAIIIFMRSRR